MVNLLFSLKYFVDSCPIVTHQDHDGLISLSLFNGSAKALFYIFFMRRSSSLTKHLYFNVKNKDEIHVKFEQLRKKWCIM